MKKKRERKKNALVMEFYPCAHCAQIAIFHFNFILFHFICECIFLCHRIKWYSFRLHLISPIPHAVGALRLTQWSLVSLNLVDVLLLLLSLFIAFKDTKNKIPKYYTMEAATVCESIQIIMNTHILLELRRIKLVSNESSSK